MPYHVALLEAQEGQPRRIRAYAQRIGKATHNHRIYPREVIEKSHAAASWPMIGYGQHDTDSLSEAIVNWINWAIEKDWVMLEGRLLQTAPGYNALVESLENGVRMGVSIRASGRTQRKAGSNTETVTDLRLQTYDLVNDPGNAGAHIFLEHRSTFEEVIMPITEERNEDVVEEQDVVTPEEAGNKAVAELEFYKLEALKQTRLHTMRDVQEKRIPALLDNYHTKYHEGFREEVKAACSTALHNDTETGVEKVFEQAVDPIRRKYAQFNTSDRMEHIAQGGKRDIITEGDMCSSFEQRTGFPDYIQFALDQAIAEQRTHNSIHNDFDYANVDWHKLRNSGNPNVQTMFEIWDRSTALKAKPLQAVWQSIQEKTASSYVAPEGLEATVEMYLYPMLIGRNIWNVHPVTHAKGMIPVEVRSPIAETSTTSSSTGSLSAGDTFTIGQLNIVPGSVTHSVSSLAEGVNYVIDYARGVLTAITTCGAGTLSYKYRGFTKGENQPVEESGVTTKEVSYDMRFRSVRVNLTDEAMMKQDGLNWDLNSRALNAAAFDIEEEVDRQLHLAAQWLAPFAPTANQSTTASATPNVAQWLAAITDGASKVERAGYAPRYLVGHNVLLNSFTTDPAFQRDGRPDFALTNQSVIARYKGMMVISSRYWSLQTMLALMDPMHVNLVIMGDRPVMVEGPEHGRNSTGAMLRSKEWVINFPYDIVSGLQRQDLGLIRKMA